MFNVPAEAFGAVRPVGAILPTATEAGPCFTKAAYGYAAPKAPAGQSCLDDDISVTGHACMALTRLYGLFLICAGHRGKQWYQDKKRLDVCPEFCQ